MPNFRKRKPVNPELQRLRLHAHQLMQSKRHDLAEGVLNQILATVPEDADAYRKLALCMLILRRPAEAVEHARRAVSLKPDSDSCYTTLGLVLRSQGQSDEAITAYMQALQIKPHSDQAFSGLASIFGKKAAWADALHWAEKALSVKPNDPAMLRLRAEVLAATGKPEEALLAMQEFLRLAPDDVLSQASAAAIMKRLDRLDEAAEFAERALSMRPDDPGLHNSLARLKLQARNFDTAHRHFSEAGEIYGSRQEGRQGSVQIEIASLLGQAAVHVRRREYAAVESKYRRVLEINPDHGVAQALLVGAIGSQHRYDEALNMAREVVGKYPKLLVPHIILGSLLCEMEQYEEALTVGRQALELNPVSALPHQVLAAIYLQLEDYQLALESAQKMLEIKKGPDGQRLLAAALSRMGRRVQAIATVESVLELEPDNPTSHGAAGRVFYFLEEYEQAVSHFVRAGELDNGTQESLGWLGLAYFKQGKISEAIPMLEKSISINPYQRRVREALTEIASSGGGSGNV